MIIYSTGDLLKTDVEVIIHQVNTQGVMGAGIALQIKNKWPEVYKEYKDYCNTILNSKELLGVCLPSHTNDDRFVANCFGEDKFWPAGVCHTDYAALEKSLCLLYIWMKANHLKTCGCPYLMGCGLAGGDWNIVHQILKDIFENDDNITLNIVTYNE